MGLVCTPAEAKLSLFACSGSVLPGWLYPNDHLGKGKASKLPEGVPGLSTTALTYYPFSALSWRQSLLDLG